MRSSRQMVDQLASYFCYIVTGLAVVDVAIDRPLNAYQLAFAWATAMAITAARGFFGLRAA